MDDYLDKIEYFPRDKFFIEVQDLVSSFFSKGNYFNNETSSFDSFLSTEKKSDNDFFNCLYLFSLISNSHILLNYLNEALKHMKSTRNKRVINSVDLINGELEIEQYIQKNKIEKNDKKIYPVIEHYSIYQQPEYQFALYITNNFIRLLERSIIPFKRMSDSLFYKEAILLIRKLNKISLLYKNKFGIKIKAGETSSSLIQKIEFRYKNHKITNKIYLQLIQIYKKIMSLKGINFFSKIIIDYLKYNIDFDDRLYEIWLLRKIVENIKIVNPNFKITYIPLFQARVEKKPCVFINSPEIDIEIIYQNRTQLLDTKKLKWYWINDGKEEYIGAIPDIAIRINFKNHENQNKILLIDAKNRSWEFDKNMQNIKSEVVQQIYILDNFRDTFPNDYKSILVAHNINHYQNREFLYKDNKNYNINVISLDLRDEQLQESLNNLFIIINQYLHIEENHNE